MTSLRELQDAVQALHEDTTAHTAAFEKLQGDVERLAGQIRDTECDVAFVWPIKDSEYSAEWCQRVAYTPTVEHPDTPEWTIAFRQRNTSNASPPPRILRAFLAEQDHFVQALVKAVKQAHAKIRDKRPA